jgi:hypothetical protein
MSDEQLETILAATADLQVSVDAVGLDVQRLLEILASADSPQPPEWVNGDVVVPAEDAAGETEGVYHSVAYPPPARDDLGAVASYVVIAAALVVFGVVVVALLYVS